MMIEVRDELSMEMAFALPLTRIVVFLQREMRIEWLTSASNSTTSPGLSKLSCELLVRRLPSSANTHDDPLVAIQLLLRRLLRAHSVGLARRSRALATQRAVAVAPCWYWRLCSQ